MQGSGERVCSHNSTKADKKHNYSECIFLFYGSWEENYCHLLQQKPEQKEMELNEGVLDADNQPGW